MVKPESLAKKKVNKKKEVNQAVINYKTQLNCDSNNWLIICINKLIFIYVITIFVQFLLIFKYTYIKKIG